MSLVNDDKKSEELYNVNIHSLKTTDVDAVSNPNSALSNEPAPIKFFVVIVAIVAAFGGLLFGFDIGGSGGTFVMDGFRAQFGWPMDGENPEWVSQQQGWISSLFSLGALCGALPSGTLADLIGRKKLLMLNCVIFTIGVSIQAASFNIEMLYAGRFIGGFAIGSLSMVVTMYQSEMAPERIRGILVTMQQLCITFGIVLAAAANVGLRHVEWGWRVSYGGNVVLSVAMFIMLIFLDESPRWLVQKGKHNEARKALLRIRQKEEVEFELAAIMKTCEEENEIGSAIMKTCEEENEIGSGKWLDLFRKDNNMAYRTFLGCGSQFLQQICGINAIMFFAPDIISTFFGAEQAIYGNLGIQVANFLATFITIVLIERMGRVSLLQIGAVGMAVGTLLVCILSSPALDYQNDQTTGVFIIVFCTIYVIFFAFSWGPVVWVLCSEIYPQNLRGKGMSLSTTTNWAFATVIGKITPIMYRPENLDLWGTFLFFSCWCVILFIFSSTMIPETAGVPLENMDNIFDSFKVGLRRPQLKPNNNNN
eukprot:Awhi_evm1s5204